MPACQDVQVQVSDSLSAVGSLIDNDAVALVLALEPGTDLGRSRKQPGLYVCSSLRVEIGEMLGVQGRNHENMRRRLRSQIVKRDDLFIPKHLARGDFAPHDLAKNAVVRLVHRLAFGFISSKLSTEFGLGITPPTLVFIAKGTVV